MSQRKNINVDPEDHDAAKVIGTALGLQIKEVFKQGVALVRAKHRKEIDAWFADQKKKAA